MSSYFEWDDQAKRNLALASFIIFFLARYIRTFVSIFTYLTFPSTPIRWNPKYLSSRDVTVVVPTTFKTPDELAKCLRNILSCHPYQIFVVTSNANLAALESFCVLHDLDNLVQCLSVSKLNKRKQILAALQDVRTEIVAFADDDVFWPNTRFLDYMLALFEDPKVGAGGPRQRVRRNVNPNGWWALGCFYLERRVWNNLCTQSIDGSISTLSGRTAVYRTEILRCDEFFHYFQTDSWLGRKLNSDDDKCLTRYVYSHGWDIRIQGDEAATIETTLEEDLKFLSQCLRWARAHWRGNFTVMTNESYWCSMKYAWGLYVIYFGQFQTPAFAWDALLTALLVIGLGRPVSESKVEIAIFAAWILFTKLLKLIPHFIRHPRDLVYAPLSIFFSYAHGFLNLYALVTLHHTQWGSQNLGMGEGKEDGYVTLRHHAEIEKGEKESVDVVVEEVAVICEESDDGK